MDFKNLLSFTSLLLVGLSSAGLAMETQGDDREPVYIRMNSQAHPLLPDGSELASNGKEIWVKTKGQHHYATSWKTYTQTRHLNLRVMAVSEVPEGELELRIIKGTPVRLPDEAEVFVNSQGETWVKTKGQNYYATSWKDYVQTLTTKITPVIVERTLPPIELKITRHSSLLKFALPDGSEVHVNSGNRVWVQTPQDSCPSTRWEDYIYKNKFNFWPKVVEGTSDSIELRIPRGIKPFSFPGGAEIAVDSQSAWVKEKDGPGYYATSFDAFAKKIGLPATAVLVESSSSMLSSPLLFTAPTECLTGGKSLAQLTLQTIQNGYTTFKGTTVSPESFDVPTLKKSTKKYGHSDLKAPLTKNYKTVYSVTNQDSYTAAQELVDKGWNPCVSNAANETTPGGGFLGNAQAQEEEICRRSTLYPGLLPELYPMTDEQLLYTPGVTVFMKPKSYSFMDNPFKVGVVSQAYIALYARYLNLTEPEKSDEYQRITKEKIRAQLRLAAFLGHDSFVAAASGCGAFSRGRQGPVSTVVATLFKEVIEEEFQGVFKEVRFAILIVKDSDRVINEKFKEIIEPLNK